MAIDYSKLSDQHINTLVAEITGNHGVKVREWGLERANPNYCNDPAEAWPLIVKHQIDIIQDNGQDCPLATNSAVMMMQGQDVFIEQDENPLRAAMVVFLMMQEASNAKSA